MNPGRLDRRIKFLTQTQTKEADQDYVISYTLLRETWAEVKPYSGRRQLESGEPVITEGTQFIIRYRPDFTPQKAMKIQYLDQLYTIHGMRDIDNEHRFWEILTKTADDGNSEG